MLEAVLRQAKILIVDDEKANVRLLEIILQGADYTNVHSTTDSRQSLALCKLTEEEFATMRQHTTIGAEMLSGSTSPWLQLAEEIALTHHERWDGRGYPQKLSGEDIPLVGRIVAVADVFDALTHERPYKKAWSVAEAAAEIEAQSGSQFDQRVVEAFLTLPHETLV